MSAREFRVGELVDVTIRGARVERIHGDGLRLDVGGAVVNIPVVLPSASASVTVDRVAPAEFPPQPGDLWRDGDDELWFAHRVNNSGGGTDTRLTSQGAGTNQTYPQFFLAERGPVELVYRAAADLEPDGGDR